MECNKNSKFWTGLKTISNLSLSLQAENWINTSPVKILAIYKAYEKLFIELKELSFDFHIREKKIKIVKCQFVLYVVYRLQLFLDRKK